LEWGRWVGRVKSGQESHNGVSGVSLEMREREDCSLHRIEKKPSLRGRTGGKGRRLESRKKGGAGLLFAGRNKATRWTIHPKGGKDCCL